jgi:hypothetical protein
MVKQMAIGDLHPALKITVSDSRAEANFTPVQPNQVRIVVKDGIGNIVVDASPDTVSASADGKSLTVSREWVDGETDQPGHHWVRVLVAWTGSETQTFPDEGPLRLDIS